MWLGWNVVRLLCPSRRSSKYHYFDFCTYSREICDVFPDWTKNVIVSFLTDIVQSAFFFFKLWIIITLFGVYQFILGLMTLILFQSHRYIGFVTDTIFFSSLALECESSERLIFLLNSFLYVTYIMYFRCRRAIKPFKKSDYMSLYYWMETP